MDDIKQFLYAWLGKQHKVPEYEVICINNKNKPRFKCELRVGGFNYVGAGNSTSKKDSQTNAALDFCQYLVRTGNLSQNEIPKVTLEGSEPNSSSGSFNQLPQGLMAPHQSMGMNFNERDHQQQQNILPYNRGPNAAYMAHLNQLGNKKMLEEVRFCLNLKC